MKDAVEFEQPRPKTILIVSAFLFIASAIATLVGVSLLFPKSSAGPAVEAQSRGLGPLPFDWTGLRRVPAWAGCVDLCGRARAAPWTTLGMVVFRGIVRRRCRR